IAASDIVLPKGNKLIIRGAYITDATVTLHDPTRLVQTAVDKLSRANPLLQTIPITVVPFSDKFPSQSTAYINLHHTLNSLDPDDEPRCDLLDSWRLALQ
ncbi:hypothetical protein FB451DRAFT_986123, partial [Mycena latifolia]